MKRRLNLLCAVILLVLGWSVVMSGYYLFMGASLGDVWPEIRAMGRLIVIYMGLSFIGIHFLVENDLADRIRYRWRRRVARYRMSKETASKA